MFRYCFNRFQDCKETTKDLHLHLPFWEKGGFVCGKQGSALFCGAFGARDIIGSLGFGGVGVNQTDIGQRVIFNRLFI